MKKKKTAEKVNTRPDLTHLLKPLQDSKGGVKFFWWVRLKGSTSKTCSWLHLQSLSCCRLHRLIFQQRWKLCYCGHKQQRRKPVSSFSGQLQSPACPQTLHKILTPHHKAIRGKNGATAAMTIKMNSGLCQQAIHFVVFEATHKAPNNFTYVPLSMTTDCTKVHRTWLNTATSSWAELLSDPKANECTLFIYFFKQIPFTYLNAVFKNSH